MKKIEAVILREHLEAVRGELERHGLRGGLHAGRGPLQ